MSEFVVRAANLAEAEGRLLREKVLEVVLASMFWLAGALLGVTGLLLFFIALYMGLSRVIPPPWAMAIVSLFPLGAAVACIFLGKRFARSKR